jgi:aryl-alcohol dehydrogenase-like predicted oxidoreductase
VLARLKKERKEKFHIATKAGRRVPVQTVQGYNRKTLTAFVNRSLMNLNTDAMKQGKLRHYGVSLEKVEEVLKAIEFPNVRSVQIIFNIFRHGLQICRRSLHG